MEPRLLWLNIDVVSPRFCITRGLVLCVSGLSSKQISHILSQILPDKTSLKLPDTSKDELAIVFVHENNASDFEWFINKKT